MTQIKLPMEQKQTPEITNKLMGTKRDVGGGEGRDKSSLGLTYKHYYIN